MGDEVRRFYRRRAERLAKRGVRMDETIGENLRAKKIEYHLPDDLTAEEKEQGYYYREVNGNTIRFSAEDGHPVGGQPKALGSDELKEMVNKAVDSHVKENEAKKEAEKARRKSQSSNVSDDYRGVIPMEKVSAQGENVPCTGFEKDNLSYHKHVRHPGQYDYLTDEEFNQHAINFLQKKCGNDILGYRCKDGAICRFNRLTGEIAKGYPGGKVKTCFFPTRKGTNPTDIDVEYARKYFDGIRSDEDYDR